MVLGCRLYVKDVTREGTGLKIGDVLTRIGGVDATNMNLKEARKIMDQSKERLAIVVSRDAPRDSNFNYSNCIQQLNQQHQLLNQSQSSNLGSPSGKSENQANGDYLNSLGASYSSQNLYVPPPKRQQASNNLDDKSNLAPRGRSRGPLLDVSLSQLDLPATPTQDPPRPPPPRPEDYYANRRQPYDEDPLIQRTKQPV